MNAIQPIAAPAGRVRASIPPGLARQEHQRLSLLRRLAKAREKAAAEIERLITFLDDTDVYVLTELEGDPCDDGEPSEDDEPSLCGISVDAVAGYCGRWSFSDLELEEGNDEPSLGWTIDGVLGGHRDLEEQCDDEGVTV